MERLFEQAIEACLKGLYGEGRRLLREQTLSIVLQTIQVVRRLVLLQYVVMSACFVWALSFFATGFLACEHWETVRHLDFPASFVFSASCLALASLVLGLSVSQGIWERAFGVRRRIDELFGSQAPSGGISEAELGALVERAVDRALAARERGQDLRAS